MSEKLEPWQMTRKEFADYFDGITEDEINEVFSEKIRTCLRSIRHSTRKLHKSYVLNAILSNKNVPEAVLNEYPDIQKIYEKINL